MAIICNRQNIQKFIRYKDEEERLKKREILLKEHTDPCFSVAVLADLHVPQYVNPEEYIRDHLAKYGIDPSTDRCAGVVIAGDLVDAAAIWSEGGTLEDKLRAFNETHKRVVSSLKNIWRNKALMIVPGNHDVIRTNSTIFSSLHAFGQGQKSSFSRSITDIVGGSEEERATPSPLLEIIGSTTHGAIAIIGLDSNEAAYNTEGLDEFGFIGSSQLDRLSETVAALSKLFKDSPLFIWVAWHHHLLPIYNANPRKMGQKRSDGVYKILPEQLSKSLSSVALNSRGIIDRLNSMRVQLATHGHMHAPSVQRISYSPESTNILHILACPSAVEHPDDQHPYVGVSEVYFDLERGVSQLSLCYSYLESPSHKRSDRIILNLKSLSTISFAESRLFRKYRTWLEQNGSSPEKLKSIDDSFLAYGYANINLGSKNDFGESFPSAGKDLLKKEYNLLVHTMDNGVRFILMNMHTSTRVVEVAEWAAPLLPAFKEKKDLFRLWAKDIDRLVSDYYRGGMPNNSWVPNINQLEDLLHQVGEDLPPDMETEKLTPEGRSFVKFSPTEGRPILYEYDIHKPNKSLAKKINEFLVECPRITRQQMRSHNPTPWPERGPVWVELDKEAMLGDPAIKTRNSDVIEWVFESIQEQAGSKASSVVMEESNKSQGSDAV